MNKLFTRIMATVAGFAMAIGAGVGFAVGSSKEAVPVHAVDSTVTLTASTLGLDNAEEWTGTTITPVTFGTDQGTSQNAAKYYSTGTGLRLYNGSSFTLTIASGFSMTGATFNFSGNSYTFSSTSITATGGSYSESNSIGTLSDVTASTVSIPVARTCRLQSVVVSYSASSSDPAVVISSSPKYLVDGGSVGTLTATITNNNNYTVTWSANPSTGVTFNPATSTSGGDVSVSFDGVTTGTTPIEIIATLNDGNSASVSKNIYALAHAGTSSDPFTATDAMVFSHTDYAAQSGGDWYVEGYVVGTYNTDRGYYVDEDSTATSSPYKFEVYNSSGVTNSTGKEIIVGTSYIVAHGSMTYYAKGSQCEMTGSVITSVDNGSIPSIVIDGGDRTVDLSDSVTLTVTKEYDEGATVTWSSSDTTVATVANDGAVTLLKVGTTDITASMTVNSVPYTSTITLTVVENAVSNGDTFIIEAEYSSTTYYLTGVANNLGTTSTTKSDAMIFTAVAGATSGQFQFKNGNDYLSYSGSSNNLYTTTDNESDATLWTALDNGSGLVVESVNASGRKLQYNYNQGNPRFACYASAQTAVSIEKVVAPEVNNIEIMGDSTADAEGALSVTSTFLYEVAYVDPSNPGNQSVTVSVSPDTGVTATSPSDGSFDVTFTVDGTYTVTVTSDEDSNFSDSTTIVVSNIYVPVPQPSIDYELYSANELAEGDYIITHEGEEAMNYTISSDRAQYVSVAPSNNIISNNDSSIVWHIKKTGTYYTIYNAEAGEFLSSTGAKNKAQMLDDGTDDKALWSVTYSDGKFEFVNKQNAANSVNANLRYNSGYGFACYATGTGKALTLYRRSLDSYLDTGDSIATLSARETAGGGEIEEGSVVMRFGITMPKASWDSINSADPITNYGIMCLKRTTLNSYDGSNTVEQAYRNGKKVTNFNRGNGDTPYAIENIYKFTVRIENIASTDYDTTIVVAPYVIAGGEYYFFEEMEYNVRTLAQRYLNDNSLQIALSNAALRNLAGVND